MFQLYFVSDAGISSNAGLQSCIVWFVYLQRHEMFGSHTFQRRLLHLLPDNQPESFSTACKCRFQCTRISSPFSWKRRLKSFNINFSHGLADDLAWSPLTRCVQAIVNWPLADENELKKHSVFQEISQVVGLVLTGKRKSHSVIQWTVSTMKVPGAGHHACPGTGESWWASKFVWTTLKPCDGWFRW